MTANPNGRESIDNLKASVDLVALLAAHGVQVKKEGKGHKARCPWHEQPWVWFDSFIYDERQQHATAGSECCGFNQCILF